MAEGEDTEARGWEKRHYEAAFEMASEYLATRREQDPAFTPAICAKMLETLYTNQGSNCIDKGTVQEIKEAGTIAAYEVFLQQWRDDLAAAAAATTATGATAH